MADQPKAIENLLTEERLFPPSDEFVAAANTGPRSTTRPMRTISPSGKSKRSNG